MPPRPAVLPHVAKEKTIHSLGHELAEQVNTELARKLAARVVSPVHRPQDGINEHKCGAHAARRVANSNRSNCLGHASIQTTERYLGTEQNLTVAVPVSCVVCIETCPSKNWI